MARTASFSSLGVEGIVLHHPKAATGNRWRVEILASSTTTSCVETLNAEFSSDQRAQAESYAKRLMRLLRTDRLDQAA